MPLLYAGLIRSPKYSDFYVSLTVCVRNDAGLNMSKEWIGQSHANVAVVVRVM